MQPREQRRCLWELDLGDMPDWVKERIEKRGVRIWLLHQSHFTSVSFQQNVFYKYLPKEL